MKYKTRRVVILGVLVALEVVLSRLLSINIPPANAVFKISFAFVPVVLAAEFYGPLWAGAAAALADVIGALLFPSGAFFPGFTLTAFLVGATFGLFLYNRPFRLGNELAAACVIQIFWHFGLDSFWLWLMYKDAAVAMLPWRAVKCAVMIVVEVLASVAVTRLAHGLHESVLRDKRAWYRERARGCFANAPDARAWVSAQIARRALATPEYAAARTVFCFAGVEREIDTAAIIDAALADGKRVCVPLTGSAGTMTARAITSREQLQKGRFGLLEPSADRPVVPKEEIDIAFVPASACGRDHARIGKGGGYYDLYLDGTGMKKLALCPSRLLYRRLETTEHDVPMDAVLTEKERV